MSLYEPPAGYYEREAAQDYADDILAEEAVNDLHRTESGRLTEAKRLLTSGDRRRAIDLADDVYLSLSEAIDAMPDNLAAPLRQLMERAGRCVAEWPGRGRGGAE